MFASTPYHHVEDCGTQTVATPLNVFDHNLNTGYNGPGPMQNLVLSGSQLHMGVPHQLAQPAAPPLLHAPIPLQGQPPSLLEYGTLSQSTDYFVSSHGVQPTPGSYDQPQYSHQEPPVFPATSGSVTHLSTVDHNGGAVDAPTHAHMVSMDSTPSHAVNTHSQAPTQLPRSSSSFIYGPPSHGDFFTLPQSPYDTFQPQNDGVSAQTLHYTSGGALHPHLRPDTSSAVSAQPVLQQFYQTQQQMPMQAAVGNTRPYPEGIKLMSSRTSQQNLNYPRHGMAMADAWSGGQGWTQPRLEVQQGYQGYQPGYQQMMPQVSSPLDFSGDSQFSAPASYGYRQHRHPQLEHEHHAQQSVASRFLFRRVPGSVVARHGSTGTGHTGAPPPPPPPIINPPPPPPMPGGSYQLPQSVRIVVPSQTAFGLPKYGSSSAAQQLQTDHATRPQYPCPPTYEPPPPHVPDVPVPLQSQHAHQHAQTGSQAPNSAPAPNTFLTPSELLIEMTDKGRAGALGHVGPALTDCRMGELIVSSVAGSGLSPESSLSSVDDQSSRHGLPGGGSGLRSAMSGGLGDMFLAESASKARRKAMAKRIGFMPTDPDGLSSHEKKRYYLECLEQYTLFLHDKVESLPLDIAIDSAPLECVSGHNGLNSRSIRTMLVHMEKDCRKLNQETLREEQRFLKLREALFKKFGMKDESLSRDISYSI